MAVPWLRLIDLALGVTNLAQSRSPSSKGASEQDQTALDRERLEAERERADRALRLELARHAADREIGRLRFVAGLTILTWLGTLIVAGQIMRGSMAARLVLGGGWVLLLSALVAALAGQATIAKTLGHIDEMLGARETPTSGAAGAVAPWLMVMGIALVALAALII